MNRESRVSDRHSSIGKGKGEGTIMLAFHLGNKRKSVLAMEVLHQQNVVEVISTSNQMSHLYRHRRSYRLVFLTVLTLIGFYVLAGSGIRTAGMPMHVAVPHAAIKASSPSQHLQQAHTLSGAGEGLPQA